MPPLTIPIDGFLLMKFHKKSRQCYLLPSLTRDNVLMVIAKLKMHARDVF